MLPLIQCPSCGEVDEYECKIHTLVADCMFCGKEVTLDLYGNCPVSVNHPIFVRHLKFDNPQPTGIVRDVSPTLAFQLGNLRTRLVQRLWKTIYGGRKRSLDSKARPVNKWSDDPETILADLIHKIDSGSAGPAGGCYPRADR